MNIFLQPVHRLWDTVLFGIGALLCSCSVSFGADPTQNPVPLRPTKGHLFRSPVQDRNTRLQMFRVNNVTLDYAGATQDSLEALGSKVSVTLKDASFLATLDALLNASDKTCRVECRQLSAQRVSLKVKDTPLAGQLDSLAKLGGGRLYVLPTKLILAPATALSEDEKKKARLYGVLLTAATLPDTPEAKALLKPNNKGKTILDTANTPVYAGGNSSLLAVLHGLIDPFEVSPDTFSPKLIGDFKKENLDASLVSFDLPGVNYGDALASFAHSVGCELYMTPEHFVICTPDRLNAPENRQWTQGAVPAFTHSSTNINFSDASAGSS